MILAHEARETGRRSLVDVCRCKVNFSGVGSASFVKDNG